MKIDKEQILSETFKAFDNEVFRHIMATNETVSVEDYYRLHSSPLTPTTIKIDTELLKKEVSEYKFVQWGKNHTHLERYGLALVNQSGELIEDDPINGSLMAWNQQNPDKPLIEIDCRTPTEVMNISSLSPLKVFDNYWTRSNIFKWNKDAYFLPHIDTSVPSLWLRLWMGTEGVVVRFYNEETKELEQLQYEPGRVYVIDTSIIHDAYATEDNVFQLFLSVLPSSFNIVLETLL